MLAVPVGYGLSIADAPGWNKYDGNPIMFYGPPGSWDDFNVYAVDVMFFDKNNADPNDDEYYMWYSGTSFTRNSKDIGFATSPDGINWSRYVGNPVMRDSVFGYWDYERINAPSVLYDREENIWKMWYAGYASYFGGFGIGYATTTGIPPINWEKHEGYFFDIGLEFVDLLNTASQVSPELRQQFLLNGHTIAQDAEIEVFIAGSKWRIRDKDVLYLVLKQDNVLSVYDWISHEDIPGLVFDASGIVDDFDGYSVFSPEVLKIDGEYHMWYAGNGGGFAGNQIGYAYSDDGVEWTRYTKPGTDIPEPVLPVGGPGAWDEGETVSPSVIRDGDRLYMYYQGSNIDQTVTGIGRAWSDDGGKTWTKDPDNPLLQGSGAGAWDFNRLFYPSATVNSKGELYLWFHARSRNSDLTPFKLGMAFGADTTPIPPTATPTLAPGVTPSPTPADPGFVMLPLIQKQ